MKTIISDLWPSEARKAADRHNRKYHNGKATAHICVMRTSTIPAAKVPKYEVRCPICSAGKQRRLELEKAKQ